MAKNDPLVGPIRRAKGEAEGPDVDCQAEWRPVTGWMSRSSDSSALPGFVRCSSCVMDNKLVRIGDTSMPAGGIRSSDLSRWQPGAVDDNSRSVSGVQSSLASAARSLAPVYVKAFSITKLELRLF